MPHKQAPHTSRSALSTGWPVSVPRVWPSTTLYGQNLFHNCLHVVPLTSQSVAWGQLALKPGTNSLVSPCCPQDPRDHPQMERSRQMWHSLHSHCICPEANAPVCRLGTCGLRIGRDLPLKHGDKSQAGHPHISTPESHVTWQQANTAPGCTDQGDRHSQRTRKEPGVRKGTCDPDLASAPWSRKAQYHLRTHRHRPLPLQHKDTEVHTASARPMPFSTQVKYLRGQNAQPQWTQSCPAALRQSQSLNTHSEERLGQRATTVSHTCRRDDLCVTSPHSGTPEALFQIVMTSCLGKKAVLPILSTSD